MNKLKVILGRKLIKIHKIFGRSHYQRIYKKWLMKIGIVCPGNDPGFIADDVFFDSTNFSLITIENDVVISMGVVLLVHDYAPSHLSNELMPIIKGITLKKGSFIGARSVILPGTVIGEHTIVGAGSVVKGSIPDNVVVAGNPARIICTIDEYIKKREKKDREVR